MSSRLKELKDKGLVTPPDFVVDQIQYETIMGSVAYGVSDDLSDYDVYGFCIPDKDMIFPHLRGEILGFGRQLKRFEQYEKHHVKDKEGIEYDFTIFNIVKYFQLMMENNPNMIDSLFTPNRCVLYQSRVGQMVRESRRIFLSKKVWHTFKGYAYSQLHKINRTPEGKRKEVVDKFGYDVKFAYHVVRLMLEVEQMLVEGDLDLQRGREQLKAIRRGEWTLEQIREFFETKEKALENTYAESKAIPYSPNEDAIKELLLNCLEEHFGDLGNIVVKQDQFSKLLGSLKDLVRQYS